MIDSCIKTVKSAMVAMRQTPLLSRRITANKGGSLVKRFQALLVFWGLLVYLISVGGFWFVSNQVTQHAFQQQAMHWFDRLEELSQPLFLESSGGQTRLLEQYINSFPEITYVTFYSDNGIEVIADYHSEANGGDRYESALQFVRDARLPTFGQPVFQRNNDNSTIFRLASAVFKVSALAGEKADGTDVSAVFHGQKVLGYIDMGLNFGAYTKPLINNLLIGSLFILVLFFPAILIGRQLISKALKPLLDLKEPLARLAVGDTDVWVSQTGDDEIVAISKALNTTINAIKGRDEELRRLADYDSLTGLVNKRSFNAILDVERQRVIDERDTSALFFIDLDQFKYVNDTLGHASGDRLLVQIAKLLNKRMRQDDVVSRLAGDEFAVLARSVDKAGAVEIANSIVRAVADFVFIEQGKTFNICCSVGAALIESNHYSAEDIFSNTDIACYTAKSQGRNQFVFYEPKISGSKVDFGWAERIAEALEANQFVLYYQPVVGLGKQAVSGFEVLLRLQCPDGRLVLPNTFIPVAGRFGLLSDIDYWVIKNSMQVLESMNQNDRKSCFYVKISDQLLLDPDFVSKIVGLHDCFEIDSGQIIFELTERSAVDNIQMVRKKIAKLNSHGFRFAIDGFGSSGSSFSYLKQLPVEYVKIAGQYIEKMLEDPVERVFVKSMVDIVRACGKQVIAEHVSDEGSLRILEGYAVDFVQGYYIGRPSVIPNAVGLADKPPKNVTHIKLKRVN